MLIQKTLLILAAKYFGANILLLLVNLVTFPVHADHEVYKGGQI